MRGGELEGMVSAYASASCILAELVSDRSFGGNLTSFGMREEYACHRGSFSHVRSQHGDRTYFAVHVEGKGTPLARSQKGP